MEHLAQGQSGGISAESTRGMPRRAALRQIGAGGLAGLLLASGGREAGAQSSLVTVATEAAARRAVNAVNQALASGDMALLDAAFAPDYVNHTPHRSMQTGQLATPDLAGLKVSLGEVRAAVPDAVLVVDDVIASGDTAAVRATFRGTADPAAVALPEGARSRLVIGGMAIGRVVNGQVAESWDYDEAAEVLGQAPAAEPTPTPTPATQVPDGAEARDVSDFDRVSLNGVGTLIISQGDTESLSIEAEAKVLKRIETGVRNGTLTIQPARSFRTNEPITYHLSVTRLTGIELSGAGQVQADQLTAEDLELSVDGAGAIQIANLAATNLQVTASGNVGISLDGEVDQQTVSISQAGKYQAGELQSRVAVVTVDGASQAVVSVSESLDATASGAARIEYIGNPEVRENVSAAASVVQAG
jgi:ketosteroid isomerase-like protein